MKQARATSFATYKDLVAYIKCLQSGKSSTRCYSYGDNGIGAWGDITAQQHTPMVALPPAEMKAKFGDSKKARGQKVKVRLDGRGHGNWFSAIVGDKGPDGVIDLNPAALIAAGLNPEHELSCPAFWEWDV